MGSVSEIKTGIDRFLELIDSSGETKVDVAASKLGVPVETIEIWAEILQEDNVIEIGYDGFGKMTVRPKPVIVPSPQGKASVQKKENPGSGISLLKKIRDKSVWQRKREIKRRSIYQKHFKSSESKDKKAEGENALSRLLKRLGVKR